MTLRNAGELGQRRVHDAPAEPLLRDGAGLVVELERFDVAELTQHLEIVPGAAADLEDRTSCRRAGEPLDQGREHFAARAIPPMALIELGHLLVDEALHQSSSPIRSRIT